MKEHKNERKRCPDCRVLLRKCFITKADLEGIPIGEEGKYPRAFEVVWTGEWKCPKCNQTFPDKLRC